MVGIGLNRSAKDRLSLLGITGPFTYSGTGEGVNGSRRAVETGWTGFSEY